MERAVGQVLEHLDRENPGEIRGAYLYGSAVSGGLRPDSDVDLLVLTARSLTGAERASLVRLLLQVSGGKGHAAALPDATPGLPLELTSVVIGDDGRWPEPAAHDLQFGEWLRSDILNGLELQPTPDPDVPILLATAQRAHRVLRGPALTEVVSTVSASVLRESMLAIIPDILAEIVGDERNTLLALARIVTTLQTGDIVPKNVAASAAAATLSGSDRELLVRARAAYLGEVEDDWDGSEEEVTALAHSLARQAHQLAMNVG